MSDNFYINLSIIISTKPVLVAIIRNLNKFLTLTCYISYPLLLVCLLFTDIADFLPSCVIPAATFTIVSVVRNMINAKRPYELYNYEPIINKHSTGRSFPSRHVFSSFVISFAMYDFNVLLGIIFIFISTLIAIIRVLGGVHFIRDVITGSLLGIASGIIIIIV